MLNASLRPSSLRSCQKPHLQGLAIGFVLLRFEALVEEGKI